MQCFLSVRSDTFCRVDWHVLNFFVRQVVARSRFKIDVKLFVNEWLNFSWFSSTYLRSWRGTNNHSRRRFLFLQKLVRITFFSGGGSHGVIFVDFHQMQELIMAHCSVFYVFHPFFVITYRLPELLLMSRPQAHNIGWIHRCCCDTIWQFTVILERF